MGKKREMDASTLIKSSDYINTESLFGKYIEILRNSEINPIELLRIIESVQNRLRIKKMKDELENIKVKIMIKNNIDFFICPNCHLSLIISNEKDYERSNYCEDCGTSLKD